MPSLATVYCGSGARAGVLDSTTDQKKPGKQTVMKHCMPPRCCSFAAWAQSSDLSSTVLRKSRTEPLLLSTVCADPRSISVEQGTIAGLILQILSARLAMVTGPHRAVHVCEKHIEERQRQDVIWQRHAELSIPDHSPCCFGLWQMLGKLGMLFAPHWFTGQGLQMI